VTTHVHHACRNHAGDEADEQIIAQALKQQSVSSGRSIWWLDAQKPCYDALWTAIREHRVTASWDASSRDVTEKMTAIEKNHGRSIYAYRGPEDDQHAWFLATHTKNQAWSHVMRGIIAAGAWHVVAPTDGILQDHRAAAMRIFMEVIEDPKPWTQERCGMAVWLMQVIGNLKRGTSRAESSFWPRTWRNLLKHPFDMLRQTVEAAGRQHTPLWQSLLRFTPTGDDMVPISGGNFTKRWMGMTDPCDVARDLHRHLHSDVITGQHAYANAYIGRMATGVVEWMATQSHACGSAWAQTLLACPWPRGVRQWMVHEMLAQDAMVGIHDRWHGIHVTHDHIDYPDGGASRRRAAWLMPMRPIHDRIWMAEHVHLTTAMATAMIVDLSDTDMDTMISVAGLDGARSSQHADIQRIKRIDALNNRGKLREAVDGIDPLLGSILHWATSTQGGTCTPAVTASVDRCIRGPCRWPQTATKLIMMHGDMGSSFASGSSPLQWIQSLAERGEHDG
jgi:hypothetical protein